MIGAPHEPQLVGLTTGTMQVSWWVELVVRPGCLHDFEKLTGEMVSLTRTEHGVLAYQRFISDDQRTVYAHEKYEDSDAAVAHLRSFAARFGERYASMVERKRFPKQSSMKAGTPSEASVFPTRGL